MSRPVGGASAEPAPDFAALPDLASRRLGGSVIYATDELFAAKENLIKPEPPVFAAGEFGVKGKIYDGWGTRRRREPGNTHVIIRLAGPGLVPGGAAHPACFRATTPPHSSVEPPHGGGPPV